MENAQFKFDMRAKLQSDLDHIRKDPGDQRPSLILAGPGMGSVSQIFEAALEVANKNNIDLESMSYNHARPEFGGTMTLLEMSAADLAQAAVASGPLGAAAQASYSVVVVDLRGSTESERQVTYDLINTGSHPDLSLERASLFAIDSPNNQHKIPLDVREKMDVYINDLPSIGDALLARREARDSQQVETPKPATPSL